MIPPDDEEAETAAAIARRIHAGEADAERELVERYSKGLLYHLRQVTRDSFLADDREVLLRFHVAEEEKETICTDLGLTSLQFNVVLFRARQRFKELVERSRQGTAQAGRKRA